MAEYGEVLSVLKDFRNTLEEETQQEVDAQFTGGMMAMSAFTARGGVSAFSTPLSNVHATGVGIRVRGGKVVPDEFVLKVYVFDKADLGTATPALIGDSCWTQSVPPAVAGGCGSGATCRKANAPTRYRRWY